jgi:anti-sigma28 factor (negative regulator of flagellin synthesis)
MGGEVRQQRVRQLREAIEGGQYRISAGDLADALLRAARQAN